MPQTEDNFIVLEDFSYRTKILAQAKAADKGIFIWTVNRSSLQRNYFKENVQGLITDKISQAVSIREQVQSKKTFYQLLQHYFHLNL